MPSGSARQRIGINTIGDMEQSFCGKTENAGHFRSRMNISKQGEGSIHEIEGIGPGIAALVVLA